MTEARALALTVSTLLPELKADLARLVGIPSVSAPGSRRRRTARSWRLGLPLLGLFGAVAVVLVPVFWSF